MYNNNDVLMDLKVTLIQGCTLVLSCSIYFKNFLSDRDFHAVDDTGEDPGDADYEPEESSPSAKRVRRSVPRPGARSVGT